MKEIEYILVDGLGKLWSNVDKIEEFEDNVRGGGIWYKQGLARYNGKYVVMVKYKDENVKETVNPNPDTWQDRVRQYIELKKNPATDMNTLRKLSAGLDAINTNGMSPQDKELLSSIYN